MDPLEKSIRNHLAAYLAGNLSLNELQDWLVGATWNANESASSDAENLAYSIELVLAEYSGGYLTPDQLRSDLHEILKSADAGAKAAVST